MPINGQVHKQIDLILAPQRFKSSINKVNTKWSDHDLVLITIKLKLESKRNTKNHRVRFDLEKLKDQVIAEVFQAQICGKFAAMNIFNNDIDIISNNIKDVLL